METSEITLTLTIHQWYKAIQRLTAAISRCEERLDKFSCGVPVTQPWGDQVASHVRRTIEETHGDLELHRCLVEGRRMMRQKLSIECERLGLSRRTVEQEALRERMRLLERLEQATREPFGMLEDVLGYVETTVEGEHRVQASVPCGTKVQGDGTGTADKNEAQVIRSRTTVKRKAATGKVGVFTAGDREAIARELREIRRRSVTLHHEINGCHGRPFEMSVSLVLARESDLVP